MKNRGSYFCFALSLAFFLLISSSTAFAAVFQQIKITDGTTLTIPSASTDITVPAGLQNQPAIEISGSGGVIQTGETVRITTEGAQTSGLIDTQGIYVNPNVGQSASVTLGETHISTHGSAITASKANSAITLGDNSTLAAGNVAVSAQQGATIKIGNGSTIIGNSYGASVASVSASSAGKIEIGNSAVIGNDSAGSSSGTGNRIAVLAYNSTTESDGYVRIGDESTIYSKGTTQGSSAVVAGYVNPSTGAVSYSGNVQIGKSADISTAGSQSHAVWSRHADSAITIGSGGTVLTEGNSSSAVRAGVKFGTATTGGGTITLGEKTNIITKGNDAYGLDSRYTGSNIVLQAGSSITTSGDKSYGAFASDGGIVTIENSTVTTSGDGATGLVAGGVVNVSGMTINAAASGIINVDDGIVIETTGEQAHGIAATFGGQVNLDGDITVNVDSSKGSYAIGAAGLAGIGTGTAPKVSGSGVFQIQGDIGAAMGGQVDLNFEEGSVFTGATTVAGYDDITDPEAIFQTLDSTLLALWSSLPALFPSMDHGTSVALDMTGSTWNMTKSSDLTSLELSDSVVDMSGSELGSVLTADHLSGSGTFVLKTDIVAGAGDLLAADTSAGSHTVSIANSGSDATDGTETLTVVETGDGIAEFSMANEVSIGAWLYGLRRTDANTNHWELYSTGGSTPGASGAVNTFAGSYLLAYAETQTLMQRLGDLRDTPYLSGFWFRVYGGKFESNSSSFVRGFDMDYGGVQVGYDRKIENNWKGDTYVGGYFGYSKGDLDYSTEHGNTGGNGKVDSKTIGAYATYVQEDGFYADALVKYMWMKNDFDVLDTDGDRVTGDDLSTGGLGISLELGKRFRMAKNEKGGNWYIEPQIQYSYTHQDGGHYYASNGLRIGVDSFTSSMGRLGVLVGYETAKTNFYAKASFVKEFDGDVNIVANDIDIPESFSDSWWVYGLGFTSRLNDRNSIYMSLERSDGGKFDEPWKVYAGWRISF